MTAILQPGYRQRHLGDARVGLPVRPRSGTVTASGKESRALVRSAVAEFFGVFESVIVRLRPRSSHIWVVGGMGCSRVVSKAK